MTIPFTYYLVHQPSGRKYYGVRYKKNCDPSDIWTVYFSSSPEVHRLIKEDGADSFTVQVRKVFSDVEAAKEWEYRVLQRLKVTGKSEWINRSCGKAPSTKGYKWKFERRVEQSKRQTGTNNPFFGRHHTPDAIERIRAGNIGKIQSAAAKQRMSNSRKALIESNPEYAAKITAQIHTPEATAKRVAKLKGQKRTPEQRERMRQARLRHLESKC